MARRSLARLLALYGGRRQRCTAAAQAAAPERGFLLESWGRIFGRRISPEQRRDIPAPRGVPVLGTILDIVRCGGAAKMHEYVDMRHRELGPIFQDKLGPVKAVILADRDLISEAMGQCCPYPVHMVPEPWLIYNKLRGITRGLFFMDGPEWLAKRKIMNNVLQAQNALKEDANDIANIVVDLLQRWDTLASENGGIVPNLETELYNWSIETLGIVAFARRLGCVAQPGKTSEMEKFVYYVQKIFGETAKMSLMTPKLAYQLRLPVWRRFEEAADKTLEIARQCTEQRIRELESVENLQKYGIIGNLLAAKDMSKDDIVNIVADLIIAAADTTSHATQWALYSLAKNPECQEKLYNDIKRVAKDQPITHQHFEGIPYLSGIIKETLRLYPIAPFLTRYFQTDITVGGYTIPANTLVLMSQYTMGRNPESFQNPEKFVPERWRRDPRRNGEEHKNLSKGCMPFGTGARSCVGKRVAELKMKLLIARAVQNFRIESQNDVDIALRMITTPDKPIQISLRKRDQ